ncbi:MAG: cell wall hydrolase [Halanaerobiaceae bacterium]
MRRKYIIYLITLFLFIIISSNIYAGPEFNLIYVIQDGDTLSEVAEDYGVSTKELLEFNGLNKNSMIRSGQELLIPSRDDQQQKQQEEHKWNHKLMDRSSSLNIPELDVGNIYSVRINPSKKLPDVSKIPHSKIIDYHVGVGDTLYDLANAFNTSIGVIMALNNMERSIIRAGDTVRLPINNLTPRQMLARVVTDNDIELLARVIHGEARGEPFIGQVAVGAVVINRVLSPFFPGSVREVIYQERQFSAVADGQINLRPNSTSYRAAREALKGTDPTMGSMYYYNPQTAKHQWWFKQRRMMVTIGEHIFTK